MSDFTLCSLINVFAVGLFCCYTDAKRGKIYNAAIGLGSAAGFLIFAAFYGKEFGRGYLAQAALNGVTGLAVGYFLWFFRKWSAGDAKFFAFFSFFLPLYYYRKSYIAVFPALNILFNVFALIIIYMVFNLFLFLVRGIFRKGAVLRMPVIKAADAVNFGKLMLSYVFVIYLFMLLSGTRLLSPILSNNLTAFVVMYLLYRPLTRSKRAVDILSVLSSVLLAYLLIFRVAAAGALLFRSLVYMAVIGLAQRCFDVYIARKEVAAVKVKDLRSGQVLVESETDKIMNLIDAKDGDNEYNKTRNYGLNVGQIRSIKELFKSEDTLMVYKSFYLGVWMFAGVLITIATGDSVIRMIIEKSLTFSIPGKP